ncbi:hypothetical protein RhiirA5_494535 [Rhizophagus irregularis]|uniref:Phosphoesterase family-domain-containing protein n=3 Tax=Rhizophagus irregularis TaxID=588596 RepID=A0A2I1DRS8_9GLOM|nr:phosphoesterase family-domain-containing protein [Rhizophagus irregularis DAOM 181602=DAOM 197198]EXX52630.1 hypothetical protein RirG_251330 [Rhizophagus irregularis DAOM 197198w]PKC15487.1 hypothetical protein RhiirA5_494535 [Rhizophagus irregularis]PKC73380.1 hypothetical protein RhiirA1_388993 [Rhizophagus irregularis]PKY12594.1 hypothetical protein RhiirB3_508011 [Rhizophagus irregularis]POG66655.1 phosphoesterase family-domain-containing protein [Rhizophagus irregularis DAOM 181602=DA|eukprot:XP_025173521.1 phosphoesterase family-domain-containing protein [Rhizophagus irregularis DAOM 181602=DAOM 197198]
MEIVRIYLSFLVIISLLNFTCVAEVPGVYFDRIITYVLGSTDYEDAIKDPYLSYLSKQGILLKHIHGIWHPSQPNYIAMICASKSGMLTDFSQDLGGPSLPESLEEKGITWKAYIENYPGDGFKADVSEDKLYVRKHNPFISMNNIRNNLTLVSKIVNSSQLKHDLKKNQVPQYIFYVPNINNNGENTNLTYASNYLKNEFIPSIQHLLTSTKTLLVVTFDEASTYLDFNLADFNHVYTALIGPNVLKSFIHEDETRYSHFSWVPTIEANWNLSSFGNGVDTDVVSLDFNILM